MEVKVLVIEDEREIIEAISLAITIYWPKSRVVSTHLGNEGIALVRSESPDIVILDLGLPDITGLETLNGIRLFSSVPVVILTAKSEEKDVVNLLEAGASDYVVKPFRQQELLARLKTHVIQSMTNEIRTFLK